MSGLTAEEIEELDDNLAKYDAAALPLDGRSKMLQKVASTFNPHPASKETVNDYIRAKNTARSDAEKLPPLP